MSDDNKHVRIPDDLSHQMGYLIAKMEDLSQYVKNHMDNEEKKFEKIDKSIGRLSIGFTIIAIIIILQSFGIPVSSIVGTLLALLG